MTIVVMVTLPSGIYTASIITLELSRATSRVIYNDIYVTSHSNPQICLKPEVFSFNRFAHSKGFLRAILIFLTLVDPLSAKVTLDISICQKSSRRKEKVAGNSLLIVIWLLQEVLTPQSGKTFFTWIDWDRKYTLFPFLIIKSNVVKKAVW